MQAMKPGEVSQVFQAGNKLAIAVVTGIHPPHPAELAEVEAQVRQSYITERGNRTGQRKNPTKAAGSAEAKRRHEGRGKAVGAEVQEHRFLHSAPARSKVSAPPQSSGRRIRQARRNASLAHVPARSQTDGRQKSWTARTPIMSKFAAGAGQHHRSAQRQESKPIAQAFCRTAF